VKPYSGSIRHDYKDSPNEASETPKRHWLWFLFGLSLPLLVVTLFIVIENDEAGVVPVLDVPETTESPIPLSLSQTTSTTIDSDSKNDDLSDESIQLSVGPGESLELLFRQYDLSLADLSVMSRLSGAASHLRILLPGDEINITHQEGRITSLMREIDEANVLSIVRGSAGFEVEIIELHVESRLVSAHGIIEHSLFETSQNIGISDNVTMNMAGIFQWDIDFIQDVRIGDEFTVMYEELWREGVKLKDGEIVAAEFINQGTSFRAARYINDNGVSGYFTPEGRSVRKAFIRAPVDFTRISSNFNPNRRHPMLNTIRAHRGVDYAAPTGTPIKAAGDGKITFRGVRNGYGNAIILQHGGNITTLYAHMSQFAQPRIGARVRQGQTIGFVGMSGLATGPHLHYEYRVNGVHRNPRTVTLPPADPVPADSRENFQMTVAPLWRQLDAYHRTKFSSNSN
jgi:murein DD-endopeptidase MepM/ murein hydrolase activator NlpD